MFSRVSPRRPDGVLRIYDIGVRMDVLASAEVGAREVRMVAGEVGVVVPDFDWSRAGHSRTAARRPSNAMADIAKNVVGIPKVAPIHPANG